MRKIVLQAKSKKHSHKELWKTVADLEKYPEWIKFCREMRVKQVEEGQTFHDVTTLLWIPMEIEHVITKLKPHDEILFFMTLPGGGKMWHRFTFRQEDKYGHMTAEITFDLGNKLYNATVGYVLEKRWRQLLKQGFDFLDLKW
jgi:ribosome-associated toxin RatA of RatAB toxin-antitoxin module